MSRLYNSFSSNSKHVLNQSWKNLANACLLNMFRTHDWTSANHPERLSLICDAAGIDYRKVTERLEKMKQEYFSKLQEEIRERNERKTLRLGRMFSDSN